MSNDFYRAFEERFRGPRELIKTRLQVYLPFVLPLRDFWSTARAVDLGCGRGEWLELLTENGFDAQGVDLDDAMLSSARELGLKVHTGEALAFLRGLPDVSQAVVSGFHIVEHIPFESVQGLVSEALRVLKPGGLLILETPNPENLVVGTSAFYLDPTHQRPIPPQLLGFLPEYAGFKRCKILRLQESPGCMNGPVSLLGVLNGVSPDYAVVAQKDGPEELFDALKAAFDAEYGLTLETLANRHQQQAESRAAEIEAREAEAKVQMQQALEVAQQAQELARQAETRAAQYKERARELEAAMAATRQELNDVHQSNHHHWQIAEARQQQIQVLEQRIQDLLNSWSWRITAPLRVGSRPIRRLMPNALKPQLKSLLRDAAFFIGRRPALKRMTLRVLNRFPNLKWRLERIVVAHYENQITVETVRHNGHDLPNLTPRARQIYADLKAEMEKQKL